MILLDTHVLVWLAGDDAALGRQARNHIEQAVAEGVEIAVSAMALWEIALVWSRGRLRIAGPIDSWIGELIEKTGLLVLSIDRVTAIEAGSLPPTVHGDPGDRMMIATARRRRCPLMTADGKILSYAKAGLLQAIDARR